MRLFLAVDTISKEESTTLGSALDGSVVFNFVQMLAYLVHRMSRSPLWLGFGHVGRLFFTRGQFWPPGIVVACVCVCVYHSLACPHDNSSPVQARITKFGPEKQNTLVKIPIVFGGNWPWPSRSNLTSNSKLTPFWACPNHYSPPILVRISKFGKQMHFSTV